MRALIVVLVLVAVAFAAVLLLKARRAPRSPELATARAELRTAKGELKTAQRTRDNAVKAATGSLRSAERHHQQNVAAAEKALKLLSDPRGKVLGRYHGVTLYERWIVTPHGEGPVAGTTASVDAQVSSRITATRLVAIGVFALAAKKKTGAVYLSLDNPHLASVIECPQSENGAARQFAVKIMNAAREAERVAHTLPGQIAAAENRLGVVQADTSAIEAAQTHLAEVEADPALLAPIATRSQALAQIKGRIAQLEAPTPQDLKPDLTETASSDGERGVSGP